MFACRENVANCRPESDEMGMRSHTVKGKREREREKNAEPFASGSKKNLQTEEKIKAEIEMKKKNQ